MQYAHHAAGHLFHLMAKVKLNRQSYKEKTNLISSDLVGLFDVYFKNTYKEKFLVNLEIVRIVCIQYKAKTEIYELNICFDEVTKKTDM